MGKQLTNAIYKQKPCTLYINKTLVKRFDSITKAANFMDVSPVAAAKHAKKQKPLEIGPNHSLYFSLTGNLDPKSKQDILW